MGFYKDKKVLVTGGTGLIGRPLVDMLIEEEANITIVSLDNPKDIISGLKHFLHNKHEIIVFHLFNPQEVSLDFSSRIKFRDLESGAEITTDPWLIKKDYQKIVTKFQNHYKKEMGNNKIDYIPLSTDESLGLALNKYLRKRKHLS